MIASYCISFFSSENSFLFFQQVFTDKNLSGCSWNSSQYSHRLGARLADLYYPFKDIWEWGRFLHRGDGVTCLGDRRWLTYMLEDLDLNPALFIQSIHLSVKLKRE